MWLWWFKCSDVILVSSLLWQVPITQARNEVAVKQNAAKSCLLNDLRIYESENGWCCKCPPGYFKNADCRHGLPKTTDCQECQFDPRNPNDQTYMSVENNATDCFKALPSSHCDNFMNTEYVVGSTIENARCQCKDGYFAGSAGIEFGCHEHGGCEPGFQPHKPGTKSQNTLCVKCPDGMFSDVYSSTAMCLPLTKCGENEIEVTKGNSTANTFCIPQEIHNSITNDDVTTHAASTASDSVIFIVTAAGTANEGGGTFSWWGLIVGALALTFSLAFLLYLKCTRKRSTQSIVFPPSSQSETGKDASDDDGGEPVVIYRQENRDDAVGESQSLLADNEESESLIVQNIDETKTQSRLNAARQMQTHGSRTDPPEGGALNKDASCQSRIGDSDVSFEDRIRKMLCQEDIAKASARGIKSCCLGKGLKDAKTGKLMMNCLQKYSLSAVKEYARTLLDEVDIDDIEHDARNKANETRRRLVNKISSKYGRNLTPEFLYTKGFTLDDINDKMSDVFFENVTKCH